MVPKSLVTVSKAKYLGDVPSDCQLIVKGIRPSPQFDLCTGVYHNLTFLDTIPSQCNVNDGPVPVASGMYVRHM